MTKRFQSARLALLAAALVGLGATGVEAQTRARTLVVGQVVDARTKAPLAGATIEVPGTNLEVVTGPDGPVAAPDFYSETIPFTQDEIAARRNLDRNRY